MKKFLSMFLITIFAAAVLSYAAEKKVEIKIDGMTCSGCAEKVKTALIKLDGVKSAEVSLENRNALVTFDDAKTDEKALKQAVNAAGFKAKESKPCATAGCCGQAAGCCGEAKK